MARLVATIDQSWTYRRQKGGTSEGAQPGLLLMYSEREAALTAIPLGAGPQMLGRDGVGGVLVEDNHISRRHAEVSFDGGDWRVRDLGSRNGTHLDGEQLTRERVTHECRVLRIGDTLLGLMSDVRAFAGAVVERRHEVVLGPTLRQSWDEIERVAKSDHGLHITGESGSGKELAARHFHRSSPRAQGPFIAVNCAAIPANLAERILFGAKKGAYSGAHADVDGHLQAAEGGVLFLDEIGELEATVQAKLLRAIEAREVTPLGASKPRVIDVVICTATHRDLRAAVAAGQFREDLLFRISSPEVRLPSLRERIEDIPWIIQLELDRLGSLKAHVSLVETCVLRPWPGNVRELLTEVGDAASRAAAAGAERVEAVHLRAEAGRAIGGASAKEGPVPADAAIRDALKEANGNVSRAARALGLHRTQLRRWLARHQESGTHDSDDEEPPAS